MLCLLDDQDFLLNENGVYHWTYHEFNEFGRTKIKEGVLDQVFLVIVPSSKNNYPQLRDDEHMLVIFPSNIPVRTYCIQRAFYIGKIGTTHMSINLSCLNTLMSK